MIQLWRAATFLPLRAFRLTPARYFAATRLVANNSQSAVDHSPSQSSSAKSSVDLLQSVLEHGNDSSDVVQELTQMEGMESVIPHSNLTAVMQNTERSEQLKTILHLLRRRGAENSVPRWLAVPKSPRRTHNIPVALLHVRSYHHPLLNLFLHFAMHAAAAFGIPFSHPVTLPTQRSLWTVPKSPFVHKKAQENFDRKTHKRAIKLWDADSDVVGWWVKYIEEHSLGGVGMRIIRWERVPVGVGRAVSREMASAPTSRATDRQKVEEMSEAVLEVETGTANAEPIR